MLIGTLAGVEMGLKIASVPYKAGGAQAAMDFLSTSSSKHAANIAAE